MNAIMIAGGKLYEVGASLMWRKIPFGAKYLYENGTVSTKTVPACSEGLEIRYNLLTRLPDDDRRVVQWRLGGEVLDTAGPNRDRVERFGYTTGGEEIVDRKGGKTELADDHYVQPHVILRPPPPKPKTADELLVELEAKLEEAAGKAGDCAVARAMREGIQHARKSLTETQ